MNLYLVLYHLIYSYTDGFGKTQNAQWGSPISVFVTASTWANAVTAANGISVPSGAPAGTAVQVQNVSMVQNGPFVSGS